MPPSKYLRHLGFTHLQEHGETDALLTMASHYLDAMKCSCCGQWSDEAHDKRNEGRYQVETVVCWAGSALAEFNERHNRDDLEPGTLLSVRLLAPGEEPRDVGGFDPERAAEEYRRHMESLGLAAGGGEADTD